MRLRGRPLCSGCQQPRAGGRVAGMNRGGGILAWDWEGCVLECAMPDGLESHSVEQLGGTGEG